MTADSIRTLAMMDPVAMHTASYNIGSVVIRIHGIARKAIPLRTFSEFSAGAFSTLAIEMQPPW